ncbi:unnamed protein product, partial [Symbiodinium pilosum]
ALRVLAAIRRRPRSGFVSIVLGNNAPVYHLPAAFNELNEHFAAEARQLGVHTLDIKQLLDRAEFKDLWHLWRSDRNRALLGPYFAREVQVLLLEATTARYYCSLKRLAEKFPFDPNDYFTIEERTELVSQIHAGQMEGVSTAREINRTAERPEAISREAANDSLNELNAIEDFYLSRIPANLAVPPLPAELVRSAEEAQPARKPVEEQSAGGNPEPGPDEVDTTVHREIDANFAVDTLGDLPDLAVRSSTREVAEGAEPQKKGGKCLEMDAEGWVKVEAVLEYLKAESDETWALAEVIDAFKFDKKQRFALRGPASPHSKLLIPVWPYQIRANQ